MRIKNIYLSLVLLLVFLIPVFSLADSGTYDPEFAAEMAEGDDGFEDSNGNIIKGDGIEFGSDGKIIRASNFVINDNSFKTGENVEVSENGEITADSITDSNGKVYKNVRGLKANSDGSYNFKEMSNEVATASNVENLRTDSDGVVRTDREEETATQSVTLDEHVEIDMSNSEGNAYDENGLKTSSQGRSIKLVKNDKPVFVALNYEGFQVEDDGIKIAKADSFTYHSSITTFAKNIYIPFDGVFKVEKADQVIVDSKVFNNIKDSEFELDDGLLIKGSIVSSKDNNIFNVLMGLESFDYFSVNANKDEGFKFTNVDNFILTQDSKITTYFVKNNNRFLSFKSNDGVLNIYDNLVPIIELTKGSLNYTNDKFIEEIDTVGKTTIQVDFTQGLGYVILAPISSPGGKYSYHDKVFLDASFAIYNPSNEEYEVGLRKSSSFLTTSRFNSIKEGFGYGFVDFLANVIEFNGEVEYHRYRTEKVGQQLVQSSLKPMYVSKDNNKAKITMSLDKVSIENFELTNNNFNSNAIGQSSAFIFNGNHEIIENKNQRFEKIHTNDNTLNIIKKYSSWIEEDITFNQGTLRQGNIIVYNTESSEQNQFEKSILLFPNFDAYSQGQQIMDISQW